MIEFGKERAFPTLLLIDDDLVSREVLATVLTMAGYTVHTAEDGTESLELLADGRVHPDAILMDAQMPGLSGTELIGALRRQVEAPVVAISGSQADERLTAAADGFLLKPFGNNELQPLLERLTLSEAEFEARQNARLEKRYESAFARLEQSAARIEAIRRTLDATEPSDALQQSRMPRSEVEIVNPTKLAQLRAMMPEGAVREIFVAVIDDMEKRITLLTRALAEQDYESIRRLGHAIKGGCGMVGATQAAHLGYLIEESVTKGNQRIDQLDNGNLWLSQLHDATESLRRILDVEFSA